MGGVEPGRLSRALAHPLSSSPAELLGLQRTLGNRATARLLAGARQSRSAPTGPGAGVLQARPRADGLSPRDERRRQPDAGATFIHNAAAAGVQGRGAKLPYLDRLQPLFGRHDISHVEAYTGAAASSACRSIGASAYATGSKVAFSGAPDLHTAAHEAAHTVQQRAGVALKGGIGEVGDEHERRADAVADAVTRGRSAEALLDASRGTREAPAVQRKVGFEFETSVPVRDYTGATVGYKNPIFDAADDSWNITADSSCMEFVTVPFEEEAADAKPERDRLKRTIRQMVAWIDSLKHDGALKTAGESIGLDEFSINGSYYETGGHPLEVPNARTVAGWNITAAPQATGGVSLDKIPDLMAKIKTTKLPHLTHLAKENQNLSGMRPETGALLAEANNLAAARVARLKKLKAFKALDPTHIKQLQGLTALVISYLLMGHRQKAVWKYSKLIAPLMSHVSFSDMYETLDPSVKSYFTARHVLLAANLPEKGAENVFAKGFSYNRTGAFTNTGRTAPSGLPIYYDDRINKGPTRKQWLESIISAGPDLMSVGGGTVVTDQVETDTKHIQHTGTSDSMGNMAMDSSPSGEDLAILELRRLPKSQNYKDHWEKTALIIFDLFRAVQRGG